MENKRLLLLGGSHNSIQILETAHRLGVNVGVADFHADSECKRRADYSHCMDIFDTEGLRQIVAIHKYDGVISGYSDVLMKPYADLCAATGKPCYGDIRVFETSMDKRVIKSLCRKHGVPVMEDYDYGHPDKIVYPVVVKPSDSGGAVGLSICYEHKELEPAYKKASSLSHSGHVIIESFAKGKEITLFYFMQGGQVGLTAYGDRITSVPPGQKTPLPRGYLFPAAVDRRLIESFDARLSHLLKYEGFRDGMVYVQAFVESDSIRLCEIGYRLTPSFETYGIAACCGIDPLECLVRFAINDAINVDFSKFQPHDANFANVTLLLRPGKIASYEALEEIEKLPGVLKVLPAWEKGHVIRESDIDTLAQAGLRVLLSGESRTSLITVMHAISTLASVKDTDGFEMLIKDFDYMKLKE